MKMMEFFGKLLETGELFAISILKNMIFEWDKPEALE